ncbi:DUF2147 domain-containing protein [Devosia sediminis]|uniref:DUF2147 domain-containing protein n=1 Tax=Devosia sediminis TaxID=2798801 RepID=A0A934IX29_9HYPH|nr:DUF2147 domain-containing protein [Devosia sediminis]MBJ3783509.1 DUF2147 domain-containing protein [Devosia sediminis]
MPRLKSLVAALALCAAAALPALASPAGVWELETRDTRFALELCGDGTQLCGSLVWLSDTDYNEEYKPYLNQPMARALRQSRPGQWKGEMNFMGYRLNGTITQNSADHMTMSGCAFLVICKTYQMYRHAP